MLRTVDFAKWVMKLNHVHPKFDRNTVGGLREVFKHEAFLRASEAERRAIMLSASESKYKDELDYPFDRYFGFSLKPYLEQKIVLDLGSGTGGRTAAWAENYSLQHVSGLEIDSVYVEAARRYADHKGISADYKVGFGENLPYSDNSFDAVLTFDVLEHVTDVKRTLDECWRVLKPEGRLILVFPTYYQPMEHHLGLVSKVPGLQLLFSGETLVKAYCEIIDERGPEAKWYRRDSPVLEGHEVGNTINGTSFRGFLRMISKDRWNTTFLSRNPIGSIGRSLENDSIIRRLSSLLVPLTYIPFIQEVFLHRITMVLEKR